MTDLDIIEERANYRVRLELDDSGDKPYDEGACPILQVGFGGYGGREVTEFNEQAKGWGDIFTEIDRRFEKTLEVFERYLRIFHGTRSFKTDNSDNYHYVAFDTAEWREHLGLTEEWAAKYSIEVEDIAKGSLDEVMAWANGEIYGFIVEKKVEGIKSFDDEDIDDEDFTEWREVDSCWGHYGRDWAEQAAKSALDEAIGE